MCSIRDRQRQQRKLEKQMGRRFHRPVQVCSVCVCACDLCVCSNLVVMLMRCLYDVYMQSQIKQRNPSVTVSSNWTVEEEIDFLRLAKLNFPVASAPEDL